MNFIKHIVFILYFFTASFVAAECSFPTSNHILDLSNPRNINVIKIEVSKSAAYAKNFLRIISTRNEVILPRHKKKFRAKIKIEYNFGNCLLDAVIRQSGDLRDHISINESGQFVRSLDVKLLNGNILSATNFKLLLPETRNGINEVLTSLILRNSSFIAPETFFVNTEVNGAKSLMLFQEKAGKELVERHKRREGPIFEGDEELLWSFSGYDHLELENVSLSRLVNDNWFLRGASSKHITLHAFSKLQESFLAYASNIADLERLIIKPNGIKYDKFEMYLFYMLALNGSHGLVPHNRKFFFNTLSWEFEPIYYDGNTSFEKLQLKPQGRDISNVIKYLLLSNSVSREISKIDSLHLNKDFKQDFLDRVKISETKATDFYHTALNALTSNMQQIIYLKSNATIQLKPPIFTEDALQKFLRNLQDHKLNQTNLYLQGGKVYDILPVEVDAPVIALSDQALGKLLSRNTLDGERSVLLPTKSAVHGSVKSRNKVSEFPGQIEASTGVGISVFPQKRLIEITQHKDDDWILIQDANLQSWTINFLGVSTADNNTPLNGQRFNKRGLTGCLTFYNTIFSNTKITASNTRCEDAVNIISSSGNVSSITITHAFADALDIDSSDLDVFQTDITSAGNDCIDVSSGSYTFTNIDVRNCVDKGISVGEKSEFFASLAKVTTAEIGVSSKDFSNTNIDMYNAINVIVCSEVMQKKQEFGGANLIFNKIDCEGNYDIDSNSNMEIE